MTTNNPDPLEMAVACAICKASHPECDPHEIIREGLVAWQIYRTEAQAATAIIAQHYAPVIAENERLRGAFDGPLTDDLQFILGQPCFNFIRHAQLWRAAGQKIPHRAEDEQAFFIGRMLHHYFANQSNWHDSWADEIEAVQEEARQALGAKP